MPPAYNYSFPWLVIFQLHSRSRGWRFATGSSQVLPWALGQLQCRRLKPGAPGGLPVCSGAAGRTRAVLNEDVLSLQSIAA